MLTCWFPAFYPISSNAHPLSEVLLESAESKWGTLCPLALSTSVCVSWELGLSPQILSALVGWCNMTVTHGPHSHSVKGPTALLPIRGAVQDLTLNLDITSPQAQALPASLWHLLLARCVMRQWAKEDWCLQSLSLVTPSWEQRRFGWKRSPE